MEKGAILDATETYRYLLRREWDSDAPRVVFVMLNPSRADAVQDDPTLRRCIKFAQDWGYGSLEIVNLFAYRATDPIELKKASDPVGVENDNYLQKAAEGTHQIIVAWGNHGIFKNRCQEVLELLSRVNQIYCLGVTQQGCPRHPLYVPSYTQPILYSPKHS